MTYDTILVVDDNPDDVALVKRVFETSRILNPIQCVADGEDAICYLKGEGRYADRGKHPYPILLLLDVKMPGKSGLEVLAWLQSDPRHKSLPVVMLTIVTDLREIREAYRLGAHSFLVKPLVIEDFMNLATCLKSIKLQTSESGHYLSAP
jgi:CheY-like chemotaxis protein